MPSLFSRIYTDFLMPSRLDAYSWFLQISLDCGYKICSVDYLWEKIKVGQLNPKAKYLVLRHDIDTDSATARAIWEVERVMNIKSSYYFRLSTIDIPLMQEIDRAGAEASYHFEDIATVAKQMRLKTRDQVVEKMPLIRQVFKANLTMLREQTGLAMKIVASHGDFVNRQLKVYNWEILKDQEFRKEVNVDMEVYDEAFMRHVTSRHSDMFYPNFWTPEDPLKAVQASERVVYVLVHPRYWRSNPKENLMDNCKRLWEGWHYSK